MQKYSLHQVDGTILSSLLIEYMQSRSSYLWNNEELIPKNVESCTMMNKVVGIYSNIRHVRPMDQRKFFDKLWRPRARFAFWIAGSTEPVIIQSLLESFWSLDCLNIAVIMITPKRFKVTRYIYNPFISGPHDRGLITRAPKYYRFFPDKLNNLHGHKIAISVYHVAPNAVLAHYTTLKGARGSAVELINYFASQMNFTIVLKSSPLPLSSYTQNLPEEKYNKAMVGPVGDIIKGRSEILVNGQLLELASDLDLEFLYPLNNIQMVIAVPHDKELSSIGRIFRYMDPIAEILILISIALFSLHITIIHKRNLLTVYFQLLFQKSIQSISKRLSERIFFFSWIIFAYFIASVHESHVMQSLTSPITSPSITTLRDIANSDLKIVLDYTHFKALRQSRNYRKDELIRRSEINANYAECILRLGKGERVACVGSYPVVKSGIDTLKKRMIANRSKFYIKPYIIKTSKYSFSADIVRKGFPYLKKFEKAYFNVYRFGLIKKWRASEHVSDFKKSSDFDGPLRLIQFRGVFGLLAIFIIVANITFIGEIIFYYIIKYISS